MSNRTAWLILVALLPPTATRAQTAKPDSTEVLAHVEKAKKIAGSTWSAEARFFCLVPRPNSSSDPLIEPTKIFDNLYAIGRSGTVVYAIKTPD